MSTLCKLIKCFCCVLYRPGEAGCELKTNIDVHSKRVALVPDAMDVEALRSECNFYKREKFMVPKVKSWKLVEDSKAPGQPCKKIVDGVEFWYIAPEVDLHECNLDIYIGDCLSFKPESEVTDWNTKVKLIYMDPPYGLAMWDKDVPGYDSEKWTGAEVGICFFRLSCVREFSVSVSIRCLFAV